MNQIFISNNYQKSFLFVWFFLNQNSFIESPSLPQASPTMESPHRNAWYGPSIKFIHSTRSGQLIAGGFLIPLFALVLTGSRCLRHVTPRDSVSPCVQIPLIELFLLQRPMRDLVCSGVENGRGQGERNPPPLIAKNLARPKCLTWMKRGIDVL